MRTGSWAHDRLTRLGSSESMNESEGLYGKLATKNPPWMSLENRKHQEISMDFPWILKDADGANI